MEIPGEGLSVDRNTWDFLKGQVLESRFQAGDLLHPDRHGAWCHAYDLQNSTNVLLFVENENQPTTAADFDRYREAVFLSHPSLVRVLAAGRGTHGDQKFIYVVTETADSDLTEQLQRQPLTVKEATELFRQIAAGVAYLHSENLISCAVRAGGIWRVNGAWKLGDYSQLRVPGNYPAQETRKLLTTAAYECPPEANEGLVSPAWDVWSLGSVIRKAVVSAEGMQGVPSPFNSVVRAALHPDPATRASLEELLRRLSGDHNATSEEFIPPVLEPVEVPREAIAETPNQQAFRPSTTAESPISPPKAVRRMLPRSSVPILAGAILAVVVAVIAGFVFPIRRVHPETGTINVPRSEVVRALPETRPSEQKAPSPAEEQQIAIVLHRWAEGKRNHNLEEEIDCYAPLIDRFYGQHNLSKEELKRQEQNVLSRVGTVEQFEISNLQFSRVTSEWAVVSFDKAWDFQARTRFAGASREEFVMRPVNGQWKIWSQREIKVYWVKKHAVNVKQPV